MKLSKRQKFIASCMVPTYGGFATKQEIKKVKLMARGHCWYDPEYEQIVAYSSSGRRRFFEVDLYSWAPWNRKKKWKQLAYKAARLWCQGKIKLSEEVEHYYWNLD